MSEKQEALAEQRVRNLEDKLRTAQKELENLEAKVKAQREVLAAINKELDAALASNSY